MRLTAPVRLTRRTTLAGIHPKVCVLSGAPEVCDEKSGSNKSRLMAGMLHSLALVTSVRERPKYVLHHVRRMPRKLGDGWLSRAEIRSIKRLLALAEKTAGPVDNGRLDDAMCRLARGDTLGLEGRIPAEVGAAYNKWTRLSDNRATRCAWIGDNREIPSLLAIRRREAKIQRQAEVEKQVYRQGVDAGMTSASEIAFTLLERERKEWQQVLREAGVEGDRIDALRETKGKLTGVRESVEAAG